MSVNTYANQLLDNIEKHNDYMLLVAKVYYLLHIDNTIDTATIIKRLRMEIRRLIRVRADYWQSEYCKEYTNHVTLLKASTLHTISNRLYDDSYFLEGIIKKLRA